MIHMPRATRTRRTRNCGGSGNCCGPVPLCCVDYIPRAGRRKELDATKAKAAYCSDKILVPFAGSGSVPVPSVVTILLGFWQFCRMSIVSGFGTGSAGSREA
jgi:hypothetical protein